MAYKNKTVSAPIKVKYDATTVLDNFVLELNHLICGGNLTKPWMPDFLLFSFFYYKILIFQIYECFLLY